MADDLEDSADFSPEPSNILFYTNRSDLVNRALEELKEISKLIQLEWKDDANALITLLSLLREKIIAPPLHKGAQL